MRLLSLPLLTAAAFLATGHQLATDYKTERTLRIDSELSISIETTRFEMLMDGEEREGFGGGDRSSTEVRKSTRTDTYRAADAAHAAHAAKDGRPTHVTRVFGDMVVETENRFGDQSRSAERSGPLAGVTLELKLDEEGELSVEVLEGDEPDDAAVLEVLPLRLSLDALLPEGEVELDASWDLESDAIRSALALAFDSSLYPAPEPEAREGGEGRERGGRGGRGMRAGGGGIAYLADAEWSGTATLASVEDQEGTSLATIQLELEGSGSLPEPEFGGGGGRREFSLELPLAANASRASRASREGTFSIELEGSLQFALDGTPVRLVLEGELTTERNTVRERGDRTIEINSETAGKVRFVVEVAAE